MNLLMKKSENRKGYRPAKGLERFMRRGFTAALGDARAAIFRRLTGRSAKR